MSADPISRTVADFPARKAFFQRFVGFYKCVKTKRAGIGWIDKDIDIRFRLCLVASMRAKQKSRATPCLRSVGSADRNSAMTSSRVMAIG
jgi:hypothetical protein